jgi:hypothetical protein
MYILFMKFQISTFDYVFLVHMPLLLRGFSVYVRRGYEVPGMILLCDLKGAMQLDHSKDMSVHVSVCTSYDLNTLMPIVWKLWHG